MKRLAAAALMATLAGCAIPEALLPKALPAPRVPSTADRLAAYLARLRSLDETALPAEIARARESVTRSPGEFTRLEAALALATSPQSDDSEILALVDPLAREGGTQDADIRAMAGFLHVLAAERKKLRESLATANTRMRDERREAQTQRSRADAQLERAERLQQTLEALSNLEKSLADRKNATDPSTPRPR
jgi:hypothetical protein